MSVFEPNSSHLREVLIFCFHLKKTAAMPHRMLSSTNCEAALSKRTWREWLQRFKSGDFVAEDRHDPPWNFRRFRIGGITCWRLVPNARRIGKIAGSNSTSHFEMPRSHGNDSEAKKLGSVRVEPKDVERCFFACEQLLERQKRKGFLHRIVTDDEKWVHYDNPKRKNHGEFPDMPPRRRPERIFTVRRLCSAFGGTSSVWCNMSCWNRVKPSKGIDIERNWCVWAENWRRNGHNTKKNTTKLSCSMTMLGHKSQDRSKPTWKR